MSANDEVVLEGFVGEDGLSSMEHANPNAARYVSHYACQNNKKSNTAKTLGDHQEMNSSSKRASMGSHYAGKRSTIIWTDGLRKKFVEAVEKLGVDNAAPRKILELMNVEGLTRDHVASYLQKYRILIKKLANKNDGVQTASKPSLLESSMANDASWNNSSLKLNQDQMNWTSYTGIHTNNHPVLNTSSSSFPFIEASNVSATLSSGLIHSGSLPNEGYSMQAMGNNLQEQRDLIYGTTSMGHVVNSLNSSNFGFVPNLNGFLYGNGGCSTEVHPYTTIETGLSSGVNMNKELALGWNQESAINIANYCNSSFAEDSNDFGANYSCQSEFVEMGSFYESNANGNLEYGTREHGLVLSELDMAHLLSYANDNGKYGGTSNNAPITLDLPNQDVHVNNFQDIVSFDLNKNEETPSINQLPTLDGYLPSFDPTFNMDIDQQLVEPIWGPVSLADDTTLQGLILNPYDQDE